MKKQILAIALAASASLAHGGTILSAASFSDGNMGSYSGYPSINLINQSGLSATYISGVTDFDTFVGSATHNGSDTYSWLSNGTFSGYIDLDLGGVYKINRMAMWNGASGISASINGFSLSTSLDSDFSDATAVGNFVGHANHYAGTVYDMLDSSARYVRLTINGNFGNSCCVAIGEIAFDVDAAPSEVPEPGSIALLGLGVAGLSLSRRYFSRRAR